ncbi:MAG TPA: cadherin-like domain-containing protein [Nitrososphaera sp.]|nr:cadherin-like domain-containing protein [Nitrososphaera sp.]
MTIGGGDWDDMFRGIEAASDGGYVIAGTTDSYGAGRRDGWIIKVDENGNVESQRTYGGKSGDVIRSLRSTSDGGFVTAGLSYSFDEGGGDFWLMKFDRNEKLEWQRTYGGGGFDMAHTVAPTRDGGYLIAGFTTSFGAEGKDYFVIKVDSSGVVQWQKRYGGIGDEVIRIAKQTSDGKYLVAGFTHSFGQSGDIMVLKLDAEGNVDWQKRYGGAKFEEPSSILEAPDGYIILEQSSSFGNTDAWIFKIDHDGKILWQKRHGGSGFDELSSARMMPDGGFITAGETKSFGTVHEDFWIASFDSEGKMKWHKTYGGDGVDEAEAIALTPEGGSIVVGTTRSFGSDDGDIWVIRLDSNGDADQCTVNPPKAGLSAAAVAANTNAAATDTSVTVADTVASTRESEPTVRPTSANISFQCKVDTIRNPPEARDDSYAIDEDLALSVPTPGVLGNDIGNAGEILTPILGSGPGHGELTLNPDGSFNYIPEANFNGIDSFTYRARDGTEYSNVGTVSILVRSVNDNPIAGDDGTTTGEGTPVTVNLLLNDEDVDGHILAISSLDTVSAYGGRIIDNGNGSVTYTGPSGFVGIDVFNYAVEDGNGGTDSAIVTITVVAL